MLSVDKLEQKFKKNFIIHIQYIQFSECLAVHMLRNVYAQDL